MKDIEGVLRAIIPAMESDTHSQYAEAIKETAWLGTVSPWKIHARSTHKPGRRHVDGRTHRANVGSLFATVRSRQWLWAVAI